MTDSPASACIPTGIEGLDQLLCGGFPADRIHPIEGTPGTGFSLLRRIRSSCEAFRDVAAIARSAYVDARSAQDALAAGVTRFLGKPARPQDLLRAMDEIVRTTA
jgi:CheY-like chemotaxis protein